MLLSPTHGFLFVHVPKTAGSAVSVALRKHARGKGPAPLWRRLSRHLPVVESPEHAHFRVHDTARTIIAKLSPEVYARFLSFSVVRNPFAHAVSHYEYMKQYRSPRVAARFAGMSLADCLRYRLAPRSPFDRTFARLPDQAHFLIDSAGEIAVNRVLRHERIAADFAALVAELDLPEVRLPRRNVTRASAEGPPFQAYYDAETEGLVRRLYARDFALFGYDTALPAQPS